MKEFLEEKKEKRLTGKGTIIQCIHRKRKTLCSDGEIHDSQPGHVQCFT